MNLPFSVLSRTSKALEPEMFHHSNDEDYDKINIMKYFKIFKFTKACISTHHQISCTYKVINKKINKHHYDFYSIRNK